MGVTPIGRPEIGQPVNLRLGDDLLARVDAYAAETGRSRAEAGRFLLTVALDERHGHVDDKADGKPSN